MTHSLSISNLARENIRCPIEVNHLKEMFYSENIKTPALLLSRSAVGQNYSALKEALPRVEIHYAVKPNSHAVILDTVYGMGGNFDVCSAGEIETVLKTGVNPSTLLHSHPIKSISEFDYAVGQGIELFVVDNSEEIKKLNRYPDKKLKVLVRFRINTNSLAVVNLQYKFGCAVDEVLSLALQIRESGHEFYGLCFHIGSQCVYSENYVSAIETAHRLINDLDAASFNTRLLDIGGGFPVEYAEPVPAIEEFCAPIGRALDRHIRPGIRVISEPGRCIAATPISLVCSVIGRSIRSGKMWYYLDDGLYSTFSGILYDQCQYPVITACEGTPRLSVLAGPTCDSFDVMYDGLMIPNHEVGDRIVFAATGAYCEVSGSNFNALKRPEYYIVD